MTSAALTNPIFSNEDKAREHLESIRWPNGPYCPHCGEAEGANLKRLEGKSHRPGLFQCNSCRQHFTVTVGSVFERSKISLTKWMLGFHLMASSKRGISAHQLHRQLGITYKTAWFMAHRIREAMTPGMAGSDPLGGKGKIVQADETYYGNSKRAKSYKKGHRHKRSIVALVEPKGKARVFHVKTANAETVRNILVTNASRDSELHTDESRLYIQTGKEFADHKTVNHGWNQRGFYVGADGQTTNHVENFFGNFKKGMKGVYGFCSEQHLQRYLTEFEFRYNNRSALGVNDGERAIAALQGAEGKRLTYRQAGGN